MPAVRALIKCLGFLVGFCDLEDWGNIKLGLETLLKFSVDRRPKIGHLLEFASLLSY